MEVQSISAGLLLRGHIRAFLDECQMRGLISEWKEHKGFIKSTFIYKGESLSLVNETLYEWAIENNLCA